MTAKFDLEDRTFKFAEKCYLLCKKYRHKFISNEYCEQLIRSSASVGSNYREANEALSKKDFIYRIKICRKESKESGYWLGLMIKTEKIDEAGLLLEESIELKKIFSSIVEKSKRSTNSSIGN